MSAEHALACNMMSWFAAYSFGAAALIFLILTVIVAAGWRGRAVGGLLALACFSTSVWAGMAAMNAATMALPLWLMSIFEVLRSLFWILLLARLALDATGPTGVLQSPISIARGVTYVVSIVLVAVQLWDLFAGRSLIHESVMMGFAVLVVVGLLLVEQLYRNTRADRRKDMALLCLAVGGIFAYDLFLYSHALLFDGLDTRYANARGAVMALVSPLIAVSATRHREWMVDISVSRRAAFYTVSLTAAGTYLLAVGAIGYYLRISDADWGVTLQTLFLFGSILMLAVILFSNAVRKRVRLLMSKYFFSYRYDYRDEWLRLNSMLAGEGPEMSLGARVGQALAQMVGSPRGCLWLLQAGGYEAVQDCASFQETAECPYASDELLRLLALHPIVIETDELIQQPALYDDVPIPDWLSRLPEAWLVVPLMNREKMIGFVILDKAYPPIQLNWEDRDLLLTAGQQAAIVVAEYLSKQALAEARQFEGFHRVSSYVMHDLKNLLAQLTLVSNNADRHKHNAEFVDDAFGTVAHAVERMNRLLKQLRNRSRDTTHDEVALRPLLEALVPQYQNRKPWPVLEAQGAPFISADAERLATVVGHLIANAQDASDNDGTISIRLSMQDDIVRIEVEDQGAGMDAEFIRRRLFKPFDSTKGLAGMGVGAYEVQEYVTKLGGRVEVSSQLGKGTCIRLFLPSSAEKFSGHEGLSAVAAEELR